MLKESNPDGRFWLKLDGTDIKAALQESVRGEWNGDPDLLDGRLQQLRSSYTARVDGMDASFDTLRHQFLEDKSYLLGRLKEAGDTLKKRWDDPTTSDEKLKELNWEVVEITNLLEQAESFIDMYKNNDQQTNHEVVKPDIKKYLRGLYKKKRQPAASHVLVVMASDEKRNTKPYALPIQYIPYHSLKYDNVNALLSSIKQKMVDMDMKCIGKLCIFKSTFKVYLFT